MNFFSASESEPGFNTFPPGTTKEQALKEVLNMREDQVLTLEKELEILKRFASSENRVADTVAELRRVAGEVPSIREDDSPYPSRMERGELAVALKRGWKDPDKATEAKTKKLESSRSIRTLRGSSLLDNLGA